MDRQQLAHVLRAACAIVEDTHVLVLGSQSILGTYAEEDLPSEATASLEADISFLDDPDRDKADRVEAAIGEMSSFHDANGYYAEGVHVDTATRPVGWRERLLTWDLQSSAPAEPLFLDRHDLAVSKLVAFRDKDRAFVQALAVNGLVEVATLRQRAAMLGEDVDPRVGERIRAWLNHLDRDADRFG